VVAERIFLEAEMLENGVGGEPKNATAGAGDSHTAKERQEGFTLQGAK
jgi:hypothetical protein